MSEKYLHRKDAPFSDKVWQQIDETVVATAKSQLCARRLIHTKGPYGLALKALSGGDRPVDEKRTGNVKMAVSCVTPLALIQKGFSLPIRDIAAFEELALPLNLADAAQASIDCARQEDDLIFNGCSDVGLEGLFTAQKIQSVKLNAWTNIGVAADDIIKAVTILDKTGFHGPYTLGLSPDRYNLLFRKYPQGNATELEHLSQIITDGIIKLPYINSGGILLCSCVAFASVILGQDMMTGFAGAAGSQYEFTVSESVALKLTQPESICILKK